MDSAPPLKRLGRYDIEGILGRGAMGVVYSAIDSQLRRRVAIKTIQKSALDPELAREYSKRFVREAQAVARLNHPNIVQVHDFGEDGDVAYIVMELIDGRELKSLFDANERFEPASIVRIMTELCGALEFAHRAGVVHRDIKPANVMLDSQGRVKLADFGLARIVDIERSSVDRTQAGAILGTPAYMSPEQVLGGTVDHRTDIFSAGIVLYQLLTGEKPFKGEGVWTVARKILQEHPPEPSSLVAAINPQFDRVVGRALAKEARDRYQRASDLSHALQCALEGRPDGLPAVETPPQGAAPRPSEGRAAAPVRREASGPPSGEALANAEVELEFWRSIKDGSDPDDFQLYVNQFPNGIYTALAKRRIAKLKGVSAESPGAAARDQEQLETEEAARREAEARAKLVEEKARLEAELAQREAEFRRRETEREAHAAELERAKKKAEAALARREAEEKVREMARQAEEKARQVAREAEEKARRAAREADEKARREARVVEEAARQASQELRRAADAEAKREAEARARREAELARREAELKSRLAAAPRSKPPILPIAAVALIVAAAGAALWLKFGASDDSKRLAELTAQLEEYKRREAELTRTKEAEAALTREAALARQREAAAQEEAGQARQREEVARKAGNVAKQRELAEIAAQREAEAKRQAELMRQREAEARKQAEAAKQQQAELARMQEQRKREAANKEAAERAAAQAAREKAAQERAAEERAAAQRAAEAAIRAEAEKRAAAAKQAEEERLAKEEAERQAKTEAERQAAAKVAERAATVKAAQAKTASAALAGSDELLKQAAALEVEGKARDAIRLYIQAARSGSGAAAARLAQIYEKGAPGVPLDSNEALKWSTVARALGAGPGQAARKGP
jgi:serine/threonine-protein kinase